MLIDEKIFEMVEQKERTRHPGRALAMNTKDLIGHL